MLGVRGTERGGRRVRSESDAASHAPGLVLGPRPHSTPPSLPRLPSPPAPQLHPPPSDPPACRCLFTLLSPYRHPPCPPTPPPQDSYDKDFGLGQFRKAADFETDDMILAKLGKKVKVMA